MLAASRRLPGAKLRQGGRHSTWVFSDPHFDAGPNSGRPFRPSRPAGIEGRRHHPHPLLGILDSSNRAAFRDAYVAVPLDLSGVLWIATATDVGTIPEKMRDGLHIVDLLPLGCAEIGRLQHAADDPVRATIDDATAELFGLTPETVAQWRNLLSQEPFMHNTSPVDD